MVPRWTAGTMANGLSVKSCSAGWQRLTGKGAALPERFSAQCIDVSRRVLRIAETSLQAGLQVRHLAGTMQDRRRALRTEELVRLVTAATGFGRNYGSLTAADQAESV